MSQECDLEEIQNRVSRGDLIPENTVIEILLRLQSILVFEPNCLVLSSPIVIVGDIHGQLSDLNKLLRIAQETPQASIKSGTAKYLFMGDYVDRGNHSLNTFLLLALLKIQYPNRFFLLRGNHETRQISNLYGFYTECQLLYGNTTIWQQCNRTFDFLPICALIDYDIFSVHGGLSPDIPLIEMVSTLNNVCELPESGPLSDLCWSDPDESVPSWCHSSRGAGYLFGKKQCDQFRHLNRLNIITRSHQLVMEGFRGFFKHDDSKKTLFNPMFSIDPKKSIGQSNDDDFNPTSSGSPDVHGTTLVDVWSAPNYGYKSNNKASIMMVRFDQEDYQMVEFEAEEESKRIKVGVPLTVSNYFA